MEFGWVTKKSRLPLVLVFAGVLLVGGCQTTEGEDGPAIQLFSADQYNIFWDQGDHLAELVEQKNSMTRRNSTRRKRNSFRRKTTKRNT